MIDETDPKCMCRLCGSATSSVFRKRLFGRFNVQYFMCDSCRSLQTEPPYWIAESYKDCALSAMDTGAADRTLLNVALVNAVAKILRIHGQILDYGGGDGLLCRLLRDIGFDCWVYDKYSTPSYGRGFITELDKNFELITAFEVFEHFEDPALEVADLFSRRPRAILISTEIYRGQSADWWYLSPESGQHVFFYSERAVRLIAERAGYHVMMWKTFALFCREPIPFWQEKAIRLIRHRTLRGLQCLLPLLSHDGTERDFNVQKRRLACSKED
jgi:Methyltransferase domain